MTDLIVVTLGGALGALGRWCVVRAVVASGRTEVVGTGIVNVSGALALGFLIGADPSPTVLLGIGAGFLGAFTTFSTWMVQVIAPRRNDGRAAVTNLLAPTGLGLLLAGIGLAAGRALSGG